MGQASSIEWTDATWNPVVGCRKVSEGCRNCYAKTLHDQRHAAHKAGKRVPLQYAKPFEDVQTMPDRLREPLSWQRPRRVFVNSVSDLFHEDVPDEFLDRVFAVMAWAGRHTFQVLTKRPGRMAEYVGRLAKGIAPLEAAARALGMTFKFRGLDDREHGTLPWPIPNVWLGVSVEDQKAADERIPLLLRTPAAVRFLSCEPLLGPVDLLRVKWPGLVKPGTRDEPHRVDVLRFGYWEDRDVPFKGFVNHSDMHREYGEGIQWVIVGGESGPGARPMHPDWARSLRDQCAAAGVAFFFKQWGEFAPTHPYQRAGDVVLRSDGTVVGEIASTDPIEADGFTVPPNAAGLTRPGGVHDCVVKRSHERDERIGFEATVGRVGKKAAGRLLDGREWSEFPETAKV